jgi:hypothetical protein
LSYTNQDQTTPLLIIENVGVPLSVSNSSNNGIVLEGVCAVFGKKNNNRRV